MKPTPILFLDVNGTIRLGPKELGRFVNNPSDVEIFEGVVDKLKAYKDAGWKIVAISNQGGIALGHVTNGDVSRTMQETNRMCANLIDGTLWCPHHPIALKEEDKYCFCRKPKTFLINLAVISLGKNSEAEFRPDKCLFVGDMESDRLCAENAGIPFMWAKDWRDSPPAL